MPVIHSETDGNNNDWGYNSHDESDEFELKITEQDKVDGEFYLFSKKQQFRCS